METLEDKINEWVNVRAQATALSDKEFALRHEIVQELSPFPTEGTEHHMRTGYSLTVVKSLRYNMPQQELAALRVLLPVDQEDLVKRKYEIGSAAYRKLDAILPNLLFKDEITKLIKQHLTIKPGAAQLILQESK